MNAVKIDLITESFRIAALTGNSGRTVSRWLDQLFPDGVFKRNMDDVLCHGRISQIPADILQSPGRKEILRWSLLSNIRYSVAGTLNEDCFHVSIEDNGSSGIDLTIRLIHRPTSMKNRQVLLESFAYILICVNDAAVFSTVDYLDAVSKVHSNKSMDLESFRHAADIIYQEEKDEKVEKYLKYNR
jgi:hypothetical protein